VDESPPDRYFVPAEQAVEELVDLVIEHLVPVAGWYREQLARHLEVGGPGLAVIEQVRRRPSSAGRLSRTTAMTPSAVTKVVRRLEAAGHVVRNPSGEHEQELLVELVPHEDRDRVLDGVRRRVRSSMQHLVSSFGLNDEERLRIAANVLVHAAATLGREATDMEALHARHAMIVRRRRAREAAGLR
jgi:hypothetical protein